MYKVITIGKIFNSNNFGQFKILGKITPVFNEFEENSGTRYKVQFIDTGYITYPLYSAILHGRVKDNLVPIVANVGFIGSDITITRLPYYPLYKVWNDMINRCYNPNDNSYQYYGAIGVSVDPSWWNFTSFYYDAIQLPGYQFKFLYPDKYQLDKDYLQFYIEKSKRVYSKNTCIWIPNEDNTIIAVREMGTESGYYGVIFRNGAYCTRINGINYGRFTTPEAAANLFNYLYPIIMSKRDGGVELKNIVPKIPIERLPEYSIPKFSNSKNYIGSTTNPEMGVESK